MKEKESIQKYRRRKRHDSHQNYNDSDDSDRKLCQLVLQGLSQMNTTLAVTHRLMAMKHFDGSGPKSVEMSEKMSISMQELQDKNMWQ